MSYRLESANSGSAGAWRRLILAIGFVAIAVGTLVAWRTPATGYEVSIYASTPLPFWIGVSIGFLAAAVVTLESCHDRIAKLAIGLGCLTTVAIGSLPVLRSYRFFGRGDSLTHLGWAAEMLSGRMRFGDVFYPGGHSMTALLTDAIGVPIERGMLLFAALFFALYVLFIPLIARALFDNKRMTVIAAFSGFMVLPINQMSNGLFFHTYSMATFLFPVFLYVLVKHLKSSRERDSIFGPVGGWNVLLSLLGVTLIFTHPQLAFNVIILLGILVVLHGILCRGLNLYISDLRPVYSVFVLMTFCWVAWVFQFETVFIVGERVLVSTYEVILGTAGAGDSVETQLQSARSVEASVLELFVKLFLVPSVYLLLAFLTVVVTLWIQHTNTDQRVRSTGENSLSRSVVICFGYSGLILGPFFFAHFMGPVSHLFFRHYGFAMVFAIVLGAAMIHHIGTLVPIGRWRQIAKPVAVVFLSVALALSLLTIFASPYIYNGSHHVSDQHLDGYETAIDYRAEDIQWNGIRGGPGREFDALVAGTVLYDRPDVSVGESTYGEEDLQILLSGGTAEPQYLPVSKMNVDLEVVAYRELRYSAESFESIGRQSGVHHVQDNGEFDLYYVTPRGSEGGTEQSEA